MVDDELTPDEEALLDDDIAHASAILDGENAAREARLQAEVFGPDDTLRTFLGDAKPKAIEDWGGDGAPEEGVVEFAKPPDTSTQDQVDEHEYRLGMLEDPEPEPELLPELPWRWAILTEDWTAGQNTIDSNPCLEAGVSPDTDTTLTLYCTLPLDGTPDFVNLSEDDVVAYIPFYDSANEETRGIIVGTPQMPDGTAGDLLVSDGTSWTKLAIGAANTILYSDGTTWQKLAFADADYKVLQRKADDSLDWDYVRAHG